MSSGGSLTNNLNKDVKAIAKEIWAAVNKVNNNGKIYAPTLKALKLRISEKNYPLPKSSVQRFTGFLKSLSGPAAPLPPNSQQPPLNATSPNTAPRFQKPSPSMVKAMLKRALNLLAKRRSGTYSPLKENAAEFKRALNLLNKVNKVKAAAKANENAKAAAKAREAAAKAKRQTNEATPPPPFSVNFNEGPLKQAAANAKRQANEKAKRQAKAAGQDSLAEMGKQAFISARAGLKTQPPGN